MQQKWKRKVSFHQQQKNRDVEKWETNRMLQSGVVSMDRMDEDMEDEEDSAVSNYLEPMKKGYGMRAPMPGEEEMMDDDEEVMATPKGMRWGKRMTSYKEEDEENGNSAAEKIKKILMPPNPENAIHVSLVQQRVTRPWLDRWFDPMLV